VGSKADLMRGLFRRLILQSSEGRRKRFRFRVLELRRRRRFRLAELSRDSLELHLSAFKGSAP
jgi:hypothetical protein